MFVNPQYFPVDLGREVPQNYVGCGMYAQRGRDQKEQRLLGRELAAREIPELGKLSAALVPGYTRPVIHTLQGEVDILVGLEFDDGQTPLASLRQNVDHRSIGCGKRRHLRINKVRTQPPFERYDVAGNQRFQPALGMHTPQGVILGSVLTADGRSQPHQIPKLISSLLGKALPGKARPGKPRGSCATRAWANSRPCHRNEIEAGDSATTSACGSMPRMRAIDAAKRSRASPSSTECTSRVARLPQSLVSTCVNASSLWSNSYKLHFAAVGCRCPMRCRVKASVPFGTTSAKPSTTCRSCCARRHASSQRIPEVSALSIVDCVS